MRCGLSAATLVLLMHAPLVAGAPAQEAAAWTIPVPGGTLIHEYEAVPLSARAGKTIGLVEELRIVANPDTPDRSFTTSPRVDVDRVGRIYALDRRAGKVFVYGPQGNYERTFGGGLGQDDDEFGAASDIAVAGDRVVVSDALLGHLSVWNFLGAHLDSQRLDDAPQELFGLPDGSVVGADLERDGAERRAVFVRVSADGGNVRLLANVSDPRVWITRSRPGEDDRPTTNVNLALSLPRRAPSVATAPSGEIYLTATDEYQVLALNAAGDARWALRVAWPRPPITERQRERAIELVRGSRAFRDAEVSEVDWPASAAALHRLRVDGHGHLYVYPMPPPNATEGPVDVYSADGEHLFSGTIANRGWVRALGDHVYSFGRDAETRSFMIKRYRLVEPF